MKCVCYNIDGLASKLLDNSFLNFLEKFDIICLVETFMCTNEIPAYLFNSFCKPFFSKAFKLSTHGRCSGGVVVLIKHSLNNPFNIIQLDHEFDNIIALKFTNIIMPSQDVIFFFTYVQPYGSPYYDHTQMVLSN